MIDILSKILVRLLCLAFRMYLIRIITIVRNSSIVYSFLDVYICCFDVLRFFIISVLCLLNSIFIFYLGLMIQDALKSQINSNPDPQPESGNII